MTIQTKMLLNILLYSFLVQCIYGFVNPEYLPDFRFTDNTTGIAWLKGVFVPSNYGTRHLTFKKNQSSNEKYGYHIDYYESMNDYIPEFDDPNVFSYVNILSETLNLTFTEENNCQNIRLEVFSRINDPEICFELGDAFWYGGAELHTQRWPMNNVSLPMQPFVTNDIVPNPDLFGNVIERYWINSQGVGIIVDPFSPLHVSFNAKNSSKICFKSKSDNPFSSPRNKVPILGITACKFNNIKDIHDHFMNFVFHKPMGIPDKRMFKSPIWSTWAKFKTDINEEKILQYADEIVSYGFSNSQLEIDDMYTTYYGELDFDPKKFPDPVGMIRNLNEKGFRTSVWVTPFANTDSAAFRLGMEKSYWLKDIDGKVPALIQWWQGVGATLDVMNKEAVDWFVDRLEKMKEKYGIDSFKFDAGEVTYLPSSHQVSKEWLNESSTYTTRYVDAVSKLGPMIEVRCGYRSQKYPVFVRMGDKESTWGYNNGIKTLIPTALTFGILGYPFVLPDMIGGNGYNYNGDVDNPLLETVLPDRELYIRWLEVTAYLPAMQFSFVPWQYDEEVVDIARKYVKIHEDIVTPIIMDAAKSVLITGAPLIRPLWWIAPFELHALETDSEFLVGGHLLVAPILDKGATKRDIYLPKGAWEDTLKEETVKGGQWLRNYEIKLDQIATFKLLH